MFEPQKMDRYAETLMMRETCCTHQLPHYVELMRAVTEIQKRQRQRKYHVSKSVKMYLLEINEPRQTEIKLSSKCNPTSSGHS